MKSRKIKCLDVNDEHWCTVDNVSVFKTIGLFNSYFKATWGTFKALSLSRGEKWETVALGLRFPRSSPLPRDNNLTVSRVAIKYLYTGTSGIYRMSVVLCVLLISLRGHWCHPHIRYWYFGNISYVRCTVCSSQTFLWPVVPHPSSATGTSGIYRMSVALCVHLRPLCGR